MSFALLCDRNDGAMLDAYPRGGPEGWRYLVSQRLAGEYPASGLVMGFSPNFPDRRNVLDFVDNVLDIRVVSDRVRRIVLEVAPADVEFLPVTLVDHQRAVVSRDYFIMNVLARRDVIDLEHSSVVLSDILPEDIDEVSKLVLKTDLPAEGPRLFRPEHLRIHTMVDLTLQKAMVGAGLTGFHFIPANGWDGDFG